MSFRNTDHQWGSVAKFFHWTIALLILGNGIFGLCMDLAHGPMQKINWLALHKSIGLTVLALFLLRVLWRLANRPPRDEPTSRLQHYVAHGVHTTLYALVALLPLSGWWFNSIAGKPLQYFKMFNLPALTDANHDTQRLWHNVHEYLFWFLVLLLVLHIAGALKHHLIDRDNTLRRMLPFGRVRRNSQGER